MSAPSVRRHFVVMTAAAAALAVLVARASLAQTTTAPSDPKAQALADEVMKASGADAWPNVKRIRFTFNVTDKDGKPLMSAKHDWDVAKNEDTVTWGDKQAKCDVCAPAPEAGDEKTAFQRWTNDSYWLLMPLKLKDGGLTLTSPAENVLHLSFSGVGLTPGDQYNVYINPQTHLPEKWEYMPKPDKKVEGTWEDYKTVGGLTLATSHQFGDKKITITDLEVETK